MLNSGFCDGIPRYRHTKGSRVCLYSQYPVLFTPVMYHPAVQLGEQLYPESAFLALWSGAKLISGRGTHIVAHLFLHACHVRQGAT